MAVLPLVRSNFAPPGHSCGGAIIMDAGSENNWGTWVGIASGAGAILSYAFGWVFRGWSIARAAGEFDGETRIWRTLIETQIKEIGVRAVEAETRANIRFQAIEARKERIDEVLRNVPSREEMNDGFDRLGRQIGDLSNQIHHTGR